MIACRALFLATLLAIPASSADHYWLAGRYDGNHVIVYFNAVKFKDTLQANAKPIPPPAAGAFFEPDGISPEFSQRFQAGPGKWRFALGDHYRLLMGQGNVLPVVLSTLVGCETDEAVGNDSYVGAVAQTAGPQPWLTTPDYYVIEPADQPPPSTSQARLIQEPVPFEVERQIASKLEAVFSHQKSPPQVQPDSLAFHVQPLQLAGGDIRYYVRAEWKLLHPKAPNTVFSIGIWMSPSPELRVLATEPQESPYGFGSDLPALLNAVDLAGGKTGLIISQSFEDSNSLDLVIYRDGANVKSMVTLQSIGMGE